MTQFPLQPIGIKRTKQGLEVIQMQARLGKSSAINRVIQELKVSDDVFVMTDAEATLEDGALRRVGRWMKDPSIGAVCGTLSEQTEDSTYRGWYRWFRTGESRADSTPIFEGSIAAYRVDAIEEIVALPMQTIPNWPYSFAIKVFERFRTNRFVSQSLPLPTPRNRIIELYAEDKAWPVISGDTVRSGSEMADGNHPRIEWLSAHHFTMVCCSRYYGRNCPCKYSFAHRLVWRRTNALGSIDAID